MNQQNDIRAAALEEAAKVCEQRMEDETRWAVVALRNAAAAIRALIDTPADTQAAPAETKACPVCHGAGTWIGCHDGYDDDSCDACGGSGRASQQAAPADEREAFRKACSDFGLTPDQVDSLTQQWQARASLAAPAQPEPTLVAKMRELVEVQGRSGNWNYDAYMHGMFNGMELLLSIAEEREPKFREAPAKWLAAPAQPQIPELLNRIANLEGALRAVNATAIERGNKYGACDEIDNTGQPYQSQWLADLLAAPAAPAAPTEKKGDAS